MPKAAFTKFSTHDPPWSFYQLYTAQDSPTWRQRTPKCEPDHLDPKYSREVTSICWESQGVYTIPQVHEPEETNLIDHHKDQFTT